MPFKASQSIVSYLKEKEGFREKAYQDGSKWAIGYGHQIKTTETSLKTSVVTKTWAETQLLKDIQPLENLINNCSKPVLGQSMFDALVEFGFNCGAGALSLALGRWVSGDKKSLCDYILQYVHFTDSSGKKVKSSALADRRAYDVELINQSLGNSKLFIAFLAVVSLSFLRLLPRA